MHIGGFYMCRHTSIIGDHGPALAKKGKIRMERAAWPLGDAAPEGLVLRDVILWR